MSFAHPFVVRVTQVADNLSDAGDRHTRPAGPDGKRSYRDYLVGRVPGVSSTLDRLEEQILEEFYRQKQNSIGCLDDFEFEVIRSDREALQLADITHTTGDCQTIQCQFDQAGLTVTVGSQRTTIRVDVSAAAVNVTVPQIDR